jgi:predicted 2-oxoglutarate/Fe(II)-dependent dioxygenase YbiX
MKVILQKILVLVIVMPCSFSQSASAASSHQSFLQQARDLQAPSAQAKHHGEMEGAEFWETHATLLRRAWKEWEEALQQEQYQQYLPALNASILNPAIRSAVQTAWENPATGEREVKKLWTRVAPGVEVFSCQLFDPNRIQDIRKHLDAAESSGIPTRRPNGMNRFGLILDATNSTDGSVAMQGLDDFLQNVLVDDYVRPLGRMLFPEYFGNPKNDDVDSYIFTIRYKQGHDVQLNEHSDASLVTLNVNLNLPNDNEHDEESYSGSSIYFVDEIDKKTKHNVTFTSGMALLHRGMTRHAALPIQEGERTNMVVWLFGEDGYVRTAPYEKHEQLSQKQRWQKIKGRRKQTTNRHSSQEVEL